MQGNLVGTNAAGSTGIGNSWNGVTLDDAPGNTVGGTDAGARNVLAANGENGVLIAGTGAPGNVVQGNYVGTDATGLLDLGNGENGVLIDEGSDNTIGGDAPGAGNLIAFNPTGVRVSSASATGNRIAGNAIADNDWLGIELEPDDVTDNDAGDADTGPNLLQNFPVLAAATGDGLSTSVEGALNSAADTTFTLDFYASDTCDPSDYGEGAIYLDADTATTDANGDVTFSSVVAGAALDGQYVTGTATDPDGNTSEFSACVVASVTGEVMPDHFTWHYDYDGLSRLTYACSEWDDGTATCLGDAWTYDYDGAGNLLNFSRWDETGAQVEAVSYVYNDANQIECVDADESGACDGGEVTWGYDAYGNLTDDGVHTYTYDAAMRLVSVSDGVSTTTYEYNGDGDRVAQVVDGVRTEYVLDVATPLTMVLGETTDPGGPEEASLYYLHGLDLVAQGDGTTAEYFAYDGLGSVRQVLDDAGDPLLTQTYDPYGSSYASMGTAASSFGFTGEQVDANGLLYLRARYYVPGMGRFLNTDPSRQEINPYQYGIGNPVNYTDPTGQVIGPTTRCRLDPVGCLVEKILTGQTRSINELSEAELSALEMSALPLIPGATVVQIAGNTSFRLIAPIGVAGVAVLLTVVGSCKVDVPEVVEDLDIPTFTLEELLEDLSRSGININPHPLNDPEREPDRNGDPAPPRLPREDDSVITFYRGGTYYDLLRTLEEGVTEIRQRQIGRDFDTGFYTSTNWFVARFFGNYNAVALGYGGGQGGEAMMTIILRISDFEELQERYSIQHNRPVEGLPSTVPQPHVETVFPLEAVSELLSRATVTVAPIIGN